MQRESYEFQKPTTTTTLPPLTMATTLRQVTPPASPPTRDTLDPSEHPTSHTSCVRLLTNHRRRIAARNTEARPPPAAPRPAAPGRIAALNKEARPPLRSQHNTHPDANAQRKRSNNQPSPGSNRKPRPNAPLQAGLQQVRSTPRLVVIPKQATRLVRAPRPLLCPALCLLWCGQACHSHRLLSRRKTWPGKSCSEKFAPAPPQLFFAPEYPGQVLVAAVRSVGSRSDGVHPHTAKIMTNTPSTR